MTKRAPRILGEKALEWLLAVTADRKLSAGAKVTATSLASHMRATGDEAGLCYPGHATIRAMTGASLAGVGYHIRALQERGFLWVADQGRQRATKYRCVLPPDHQPVGDHKAAVITKIQAITHPHVITNSDASDHQSAPSKNSRLRKLKPLVARMKIASDHQPIGDPNKDRTEISGGAPQARPPDGAAISKILAADEIEPADDVLARALGARSVVLIEPESFCAAHRLDDAALAQLAAASFPGEARDDDRTDFR